MMTPRNEYRLHVWLGAAALVLTLAWVAFIVWAIVSIVHGIQN